RPDGGRGFGFTGYHKHANLADDNFRTLLLNAVAWVSKLEVPAKGVSSKTLSRDDLERLIDEGKLAVKRPRISTSTPARRASEGQVHPSLARRAGRSARTRRPCRIS